MLEARTRAARLAALTADGRYAEALDLAEESMLDLGRQKVLLVEVSRTANRAGAMMLRRRAVHALAQVAPSPSHDRVLRSLRGRIRETSPAWSPTVDPAVAARLGRVVDPVPDRVLHVLKISVPHRQSGYSVRARYSLAGQLAAGLDPVAVTALDFPSGTDEGPVAALDLVDGVPYHRLLRADVPAEEAFDSYLDAWATALAPVVAEQRPEVMTVHSGHRGYESALVALAVGDLLGVPVVYEVRGFFESLWSKDLRWAERSETYHRRRDTETRCMRRASAVVTLSDSMREDIVARGVDPATVTVVPNGVDTDVFRPQEPSAELRGRLGLEGRFVFGYVSNLDHWREGQELLVQAAVTLRERGVPATALVVGDGSRREELQRLADELGAGDTVVFTGSVPHEEITSYYALYDVFVVPRVDERAARLVTPLKPFEAMAAGLPLLVSDLPALEEVIGGGERGTTFRAGDATDLADRLVELQQDEDRRARTARAGRDWVVAQRQWAHNGDRYRAVYDRVLGR